MNIYIKMFRHPHLREHMILVPEGHGPNCVSEQSRCGYLGSVRTWWLPGRFT